MWGDAIGTGVVAHLSQADLLISKEKQEFDDDWECDKQKPSMPLDDQRDEDCGKSGVGVSGGLVSGCAEPVVLVENGQELPVRRQSSKKTSPASNKKECNVENEKIGSNKVEEIHDHDNDGDVEDEEEEEENDDEGSNEEEREEDNDDDENESVEDEERTIPEELDEESSSVGERDNNSRLVVVQQSNTSNSVELTPTKTTALSFEPTGDRAPASTIAVGAVNSNSNSNSSLLQHQAVNNSMTSQRGTGLSVVGVNEAFVITTNELNTKNNETSF